MEQYKLVDDYCCSSLWLALKHYTPAYLFIRDCGGIRKNGKYSPYGKCKVSQDLDGKTLTFHVKDGKVLTIIDNETVFEFNYTAFNDFSLAYLRYDEDGYPIYPRFPHQPYNYKYPEPVESMIRNVIDHHLIEITFEGRIDIEFERTPKEAERSWSYWRIVPPHS